MKKNKIIYIYIQVIFIMIAVIFYQINLNNFSSIYFWNIYNIIMLIWVLYTSAKITKKIFSLYTMLYTFFYLFNFGQIFVYCFQLTDKWYITKVIYSFSDMVVINAVSFISLCLLFMHLSALIVLKNQSGVLDISSYQDFELKKVWCVGVILFVICIIPALIYDGTYIITNLTKGYMSVFGLNVNSGILDDLAKMLKPAFIFLVIGNLKDRKKFHFWLYFGMIYSGIRSTLSGQRGYDLAFIVTLLMLKYQFYPSRKKKREIVKYIILIIIGFKILNMVANLRGFSIEKVTFDILVENLLDNSFIINQMSEFGATLQTTCGFIDRIPGDIEFGYGSSYVKALLSMLPNLSFFSIFSWSEGANPVLYLSKYIQHVGGSLFGEFYYNFGWYGVISSMIWGSISGCIANKINSKKVFNIATVYIIYTMFVWLVRDSFSYLPRTILCNIVIPYFIYKFLEKKYFEKHNRGELA